jgi:hypothetical protein
LSNFVHILPKLAEMEHGYISGTNRKLPHF